MKDLTITKKQQKRELITFLACFVIAFALNIFAVIYYESPASELITSIFYVLSFAVCLYVFWGIIRMIAYLIKTLIKKK